MICIIHYSEVLGGSDTDGEGMDLSSLLTQITTFINQQNQQIQTLIAAIMKNVQQVTSQDTIINKRERLKMSPSFTDALCHYIPYQFKR
jgi:hypothetical protein